MQQNTIEEMNKIILQPSGSSDANKHYYDTIENQIGLDLVGRFISNNDLSNLTEIYQGQACMIWGVTPGGSNITKWNRITPGDVTLFSRNGRIYASAITTYKLHNRDLAYVLWNENTKGETWEYIYFLDELVNHNIPYANFNRVVGYNENYVIQGFNVLDEQKSQRVISHYNLESSYHFHDISGLEFKNAIADISDMDEADAKIKGYRRLEQGYLRRHLFGRKKIDSCGICNNEYPIAFLSAAHIKKRSKCTLEEKLDINVVMPMCKFGCDELFERGYIFVEEGKIKINDTSFKSKTLLAYCILLDGKSCQYFNDNTLEYFKWHKSYHKIV